jgi:glutamate/tyrosine decarboxylase-like PLP-dependent enzyme
MNVVSCCSIASIIGVLLPAIYNPNLVSDDTAHGIMEAELRVTAMAADLIGYDPNVASGLFTFGGTGTLLYGVKIGLEKALPGTMETGIQGDAVVLASEQCHYSRLNVTGWLGLGERNVVEVPSRAGSDVDLDLLAEAAERALTDGRRIAAIIASMGTTDAFGVDDLESIVALRDRLVTQFDLDYRPHVHADAVIGWAWSVFTGYSFEENALGFRPRTVRALAGALHRIQHLDPADSVGLDFHKTGFAPYVSSLFLVRDEADLQQLVRGRADMPICFRPVSTIRACSRSRQPKWQRRPGGAGQSAAPGQDWTPCPARPPRRDGRALPGAPGRPPDDLGAERREFRHRHAVSGVPGRR